MTRLTLLVDKIATLVLALVLLAGGLTAVWWWSDRPVAGRTLPGTADTAPVADVVTASWFPWAAAATGVVLGLVGLRWVLAHLATGRVRTLRLPGSGTTGRLEVDAGKVTAAAADAFADTLGVRSARGVVVRDRGQLVARLDATLEPEADLEHVARRAEEMSGQLAAALGRPDLRFSLRLRVATRGRSLTRVR